MGCSGIWWHRDNVWWHRDNSTSPFRHQLGCAATSVTGLWPSFINMLWHLSTGACSAFLKVAAGLTQGVPQGWNISGPNTDHWLLLAHRQTATNFCPEIHLDCHPHHFSSCPDIPEVHLDICSHIDCKLWLLHFGVRYRIVLTSLWLVYVLFVVMAWTYLCGISDTLQSTCQYCHCCQCCLYR